MPGSDPAAPLQRAVFDALSGGACQTAAGVPFGVYDSVPSTATFPYAVLNGLHVMGDQAVGYEGSDTEVTVTVWSRAKGWPQCQAIASAVRDALEAIDTVTGHVVLTWTFRDVLYLPDLDGITRKAVIKAEVLTQPAV